MSTNTRYSTDALKRLGVQKKVVRKEDRFLSSFKNATSLQRSIDNAAINLSDRTLSNDFITADAFFIAKEYFMKNGVSESPAETMSLIINDVAKSQNKSVVAFLFENEQNGIIFDIQAYILMNVFRSSSDKTNILVTGSNKNCYRSRNILA